jgi:alkaline phosphatase
MKRRQFFTKAGLFGLGSAIFNPLDILAQPQETPKFSDNTPKNIIFLVSDGMSIGTLNMADLYLKRKTGKGSRWVDLYKENKITRGLMDMASASSLVTDSAAASSSWGGGYRVKNGRINVGEKGEQHIPIWQKFQKAGKKTGCVTTVPITHATPAGFLVNSESRKDMQGIAISYLKHEFDVLMGGGTDVFSGQTRKDGKDMFKAFAKKGYEVVQTRSQMNNASTKKSILGVFNGNSLPYTLDRNHDVALQKNTPTLAEMTKKAIENMQSNPDGFVLQVEAGKVDWAAHANCVGGLIYDQVAFDEAVGVAMDFAEKDRETLVIITTDHGNSNPGLLYGKKADENFDRIQSFKHSNEWILNGITADFNINQVIERIEYANGYNISREDAYRILGYYNGLEKENDGLYNYKKLPYKLLADIQKKFTSVGWIGDHHSADYVEIAMYGPGSKHHIPFIKNTDLHWYLLEVAGVKTA